MQLFATLLIAASLVASALAFSVSKISARHKITARTAAAPDFFAGTQVGQGQSPFSPLSDDNLIPMSRALH